jgi:multidrug efflux RND transporter mexF
MVQGLLETEPLARQLRGECYSEHAFGLILVPGLYYIFGRMADHVKMVRYQRNKPLTEEKDKRYKLENDEKK